MLEAEGREGGQMLGRGEAGVGTALSSGPWEERAGSIFPAGRKAACHVL